MKKYKQILLLYSGGYDSTLLLEWANKYSEKPPYCVMFNYGQQHLKELEKAIDKCTIQDLEWRQIDITIPIRSKLVNDDGTRYEGVSEWYVPGRNTIFVSIAASLAETLGIDTIWIGANFEDRMNRFPDCTQEWVMSMNETLRQGLSKPIMVEAPLLGLSKKMIVQIADELGITEDQVFSGYGERSEDQ